MGKIKESVIKMDSGDYKKHIKREIETVVTSISIEKKHKQFLDRTKLNLSALVRDLLDKFMASESKDSSPTKSGS